jgi:acetyl CoA:N6-hydroxylysine acetyl transferase
MKLQLHIITLGDADLVLRPMTEADWGILLKWNSDPQVLYYAESGNIQAHTLDEVQGIYRQVSQTAFCFIAEVNGLPIGECWVQRMNLDRIMQRYPDQVCRRIDLMIGEKALWGKGYGTRMIRLLTGLAFEVEHADAVFGCEIGDYNPRSQRAFQKAGFRLDAQHEQPPGQKAKVTYDLVITRQMYLEQNNS